MPCLHAGCGKSFGVFNRNKVPLFWCQQSRDYSSLALGKAGVLVVAPLQWSELDRLGAVHCRVLSALFDTSVCTRGDGTLLTPPFLYPRQRLAQRTCHDCGIDLCRDCIVKTPATRDRAEKSKLCSRCNAIALGTRPSRLAACCPWLFLGRP